MEVCCSNVTKCEKFQWVVILFQGTAVNEGLKKMAAGGNSSQLKASDNCVHCGTAEGVLVSEKPGGLKQ